MLYISSRFLVQKTLVQNEAIVLRRDAYIGESREVSGIHWCESLYMTPLPGVAMSPECTLPSSLRTMNSGTSGVGFGLLDAEKLFEEWFILLMS
jgi:hypothetical protein